MSGQFKRRRRRKVDGVQIVATILAIVFTAIVFIPFWTAVVTSFDTTAGAAKSPFALIPGEFTLENYQYLFERNGRTLLIAYKGSIIVTVGTTVLCIVMQTMCAYGFSRKFPGKKFFFMMLVVTMFFGGGLIPTYLLYKNLGLLNTYWAVIIAGLVNPSTIIIMKNGFESVPMDLQEAAMMDGATELTIFARVMLPLQKPLIASFSLFAIVGNWNIWYWPMLVFSGGGDKTVLQLFLKGIVNNLDVSSKYSDSGVGLGEIIIQYSEGIKMAAVFVVMAPIMIIYPFLQKYFAKGIMVGAVKM